MKSNLTLSLVAMFFMTLFSACEKEADQISMLDTSATAGAKAAVSISIDAENEVNLGDVFTITGVVSSGDPASAVGCGKVQIQKWDGESFVNVSDNGGIVLGSDGKFEYSTEELALGEHKYQAHYVSGGCDYANAFTDEFTVSVVDNCDGVSFVISPVTADDNQVSFTLTLDNCPDLDLTGLKIQGGLISGAGRPTVTVNGNAAVIGENFNIKENINGKGVIVNYITTISNQSVDGEDKLVVNVSYVYDGKATLTSGTEVSGSWTVKDADGNLIGSATAIVE